MLLCLASFASASGYVRIVLNGKKLYWSGQPHWVLNNAGSDNIADESEKYAIKQAFQSWENVPGTSLNFFHDGNTGSTNFGSHSTHLVMFDENGSSGWFPPGSGIVAITPITYSTSSGRILDADILFNGRDWTFATDGRNGAFDVQDIATHEIGHFIGLDHSPVIGSSMWPYVSSGQWLHRGLADDDRAGVIAVKPFGGDSRLKGTVRDSSSQGITGALVAAVDLSDGRLAGSAMSSSGGSWTIRGLNPGSYQVYAAPVEGGMSASNLTGNGNVNTSFGADFYGGHYTPTSFSVAAGETKDIGSWLMPADSVLVDNTSSVAQIRPGETKSVSIWGSAFQAGQMEVWSLSPHLTINNVNGGSSWMQVSLTASSAIQPGSYDLYIRKTNGEFEAISGVVDVVLPIPTLNGLSAVSGSHSGGDTVQIFGSNLQDDSYVLFGGVECPSVALLDANTLEVVTPAGVLGPVDVSVNAPDGQQARLNSSFTYAALPQFIQMFPTAGNKDGGTVVLINGNDLATDIQVDFGGSSQSVEWVSEKLVKVTTASAIMGVVDVTLTNPGSDPTVVADAFIFVPFPDPRITDFTPIHGKESGGFVVKLTGIGLTNADSVLLGVDAVNATGGVEGQSLMVVDEDTIQVTSPTWKAGSYGIKISLPNGQGIVAPSTFLYKKENKQVAGCGGLIGRQGVSVNSSGDMAVMAFLFLGFHIFRRRQRRYVLESVRA